MLILFFFFFFGFSDVACYLEDIGIRVFLVAMCCQMVRRPKSIVAITKLLHGQVKKYRVSFSAMPGMEVCPASYFWWCGSFWGPWVSFIRADEFSVRFTEITSRICVSWTHSLPFWFWPHFNSVKWPYYQKDVNKITLNQTTLWNLTLPIFDVLVRTLLNVNYSWNQTLLIDIFALCDTNLHESIDFSNFSIGGYLPLIRKYSVSHEFGRAVCVK